jgi:hypothetical protein
VVLIHHNHPHNNKHKNKRDKNEKPRDSSVAILANQVQNPSPEKDVNELDNENQGRVRNAGRKRT